MKILFLSYANSFEDKKEWSGTMYKVYYTLANTYYQGKKIEMSFLSCKTDYTLKERVFRKGYLLSKKLHSTNKRWLEDFTEYRKDAIARKIENQSFSEYDMIFVLASSVIASALHKVLEKKNCKTPYIYLADATFSAVEEYYPEFSNLSSVIHKQANKISKEAFEHSYKSIVSSDWAKEHAINDYGVSPAKIEVIEFGANIDTPILGKNIRSFDKNNINLLLCGVHWKRKGGEIAINCCKRLKQLGYNVNLHIVGMEVPEKHKGLDFIVSHGFLNKNIPEQYDQLVNIMLGADILLFPSRAECSAISLCEAAGFGLPTFCYDTGGLSNYVINGVNGYRLPLSASGDEFGERIGSCISMDELQKLNKGALSLYNEKLNWANWSRRFVENVLSL